MNCLTVKFLPKLVIDIIIANLPLFHIQHYHLNAFDQYHFSLLGMAAEWRSVQSDPGHVEVVVHAEAEEDDGPRTLDCIITFGMPEGMSKTLCDMGKSLQLNTNWL